MFDRSNTFRRRSKKIIQHSKNLFSLTFQASFLYYMINTKNEQTSLQFPLTYSHYRKTFKYCNSKLVQISSPLITQLYTTLESLFNFN